MTTKKIDIENIKFIQNEGKEYLQDTISFSTEIDKKTFLIVGIMKTLSIPALIFVFKSIYSLNIETTVTIMWFLFVSYRISKSLLETVNPTGFYPRGNEPMNYLKAPKDYIFSKNETSLLKSLGVLQSKISANYNVNQNKSRELQKCIRKIINLPLQLSLVFGCLYFARFLFEKIDFCQLSSALCL